MRKVLVLAAALMLCSALAFAGPFFGVDYGGGGLDIYTGASFDTITIGATFAGLNTQTPSATVSIDAEDSFGNVDWGAGIDFIFAPITEWPAPWVLDGIALTIDGEVDLSALFETTWDVELSGNLGLLLDDSLVAALTWGVGFYIEMPWPIEISEMHLE